MERALQALVLSQYRLKVFQDHRLGIKPVVLFKAAKIADSKDFMAEFIETVKKLTGAQLRSLSTAVNNEVMHKAFAYFANNGISFDTLAAELRDDFSEEHCVSVNDDKDATQKQILLNSLEDADNPYRAIFEVKKLDEGWDVLNLFDIVRLYETRQSSGKKIAPATIAEAQLIGRGARYCPFQLDDEQPKFQRKYDEDVTCELRVCETLYYHCQNDHRYVTELRNALREIGLDTDKIVQREYVLKDDFKGTDLYQQGLIFLNDREVKDRKDVHGLTPTVRDDIYRFQAATGASGFDSVMVETSQGVDLVIDLKTAHMTIKEIAAINYAIVNKALRNIRFLSLIPCVPIFRMSHPRGSLSPMMSISVLSVSTFRARMSIRLWKRSMLQFSMCLAKSPVLFPALKKPIEAQRHSGREISEMSFATRLSTIPILMMVELAYRRTIHL